MANASNKRFDQLRGNVVMLLGRKPERAFEKFIIPPDKQEVLLIGRDYLICTAMWMV